MSFFNLGVFSKSKKETCSTESLVEPGKPTSDSAYDTSLQGKLSIVLGILAVLAIYSMFSPRTMDLPRRLYRSVPNTQCVIYDRPPRTGSTTISRTLGSCLSDKGYHVAGPVSGVRSTLVPAMVSSESDRMAIARNHVAMTEHDLLLLEEHCGKLLYITSAAPMKKRLYSVLKYALLHGDGNWTITRDMVEFARKREKRVKWDEVFLEAYPHVTDQRTPRDVIPDRIVPDYVIRNGMLNDDLTAVLDALRCNTTIESMNVHKATSEESEVLDAIKLYSGDTVYKWLMEVSKDNGRGLIKARAF